MLILHKQDGNKGSFYIEENEKVLAEMTYTHAGPALIIIDHTEVLDELRGRQVGLSLVNRAADYAREARLKILPLCPFAKSVFDKYPETFSDVLRT